MFEKRKRIALNSEAMPDDVYEILNEKALRRKITPFIIELVQDRIKEKELLEKLDEFATYNDSLEEVFENKEQIEVSKFYEKLPKPHALAVQEWLDGKIYHRNTEK